VFIGEAPGEEEDRQGQPFVGPAGQLLDKMIDAMGFSRDEVYVANIVKCRPPDNRKPDASEMAKCRPFLEAQLAALKPECVVALGATALTGLFGPNEGITKARGRFRTFGGDTLVMPTYHPADLLRVPSAKKDTWADLLQVVRAMGRTPKAR
jgi:DNA polymerase